MTDYNSTTVGQRAKAILDAANHHVYGLNTAGVCEKLIADGHVKDMPACTAISKDALLFMGFPLIVAEEYKRAGKTPDPWSMSAIYKERYGEDFLYYFYKNGAPVNERIKWLKENVRCHEPWWWVFGGGANACTSYYSDENRIDMIAELRWRFALQVVALEDQLPAIWFFKMIASDEHNSAAVRKAAEDAMFQKNEKLIESLTPDGIIQEDFDRATAVREAYAGHVYGLDTKGVCEELIDDEAVADMDECNYLSSVLGLGEKGICTADERVALLNKFSMDYMVALCELSGIGAANDRIKWLAESIGWCYNPLYQCGRSKSHSYYSDSNTIDMIHELGQMAWTGAFEHKLLFESIANNNANSEAVKGAAIEELSR